jgi:glycosyltransferase involved in cell wall biosynthesis
MRAAVDVTPLLGARTGIGELVAGLIGALNDRDDVQVVPVALTWRGRGEAGAGHRPIPARLVQRLWSRHDVLPISRWVSPVDVVHGTNYVVGPPSHGRSSHGRSAAPRIVTVHDLATVKTPELCHADTLVFPQLIRRAVASGAFVQTDSQTTADEVIDWLKIDPNRVRAIYPGVPTLGAGRSTGLDPRVHSQPFLLSLGTEDPRKGLHRLVAVLPELLRTRPDLLWVHAGGNGWGTDQLNAAISQLTTQQRSAVVRLGRVTNDQRAWLLRNAEVFVYPSINEGFGFPPLEALSVQTPVIAHQLPVLAEVLGSTNAVLVDAGNPKLLLNAILAQPGRRPVTDKNFTVGDFSWSQMAARQVQWYRDVIA